MLPVLSLKKSEIMTMWLGQSGFYFLTGEGLKIIVDPYLSDSATVFGKKFGRVYSPPVTGKDLDPDIFLITHDHLDHFDEETIRPVPKKDKIIFIGPRGVKKHFDRMRIIGKNIVRLDAGENINVKGVNISAVFAMPTDAGTIDTIGFVITFKNGKKFYITGDSAYSDFLGCYKKLKIDVMFTVINGFSNNMDEAEAAAAVKLVKPKTVVPMHFGLMKMDRTDVGKFVNKVKKENKDMKIMVPELMRPVVF